MAGIVCVSRRCLRSISTTPVLFSFGVKNVPVDRDCRNARSSFLEGFLAFLHLHVGDAISLLMCCVVTSEYTS